MDSRYLCTHVSHSSIHEAYPFRGLFMDVVLPAAASYTGTIHYEGLS